MKQLDRFLLATYAPQRFEATLQAFLRDRRADGLSAASVWHLYRSLAPLAEAVSKPVGDITAHDLHAYLDALKTRYAPGTLRAVVGDIKQFFHWCQEQGEVAVDPAAKLKKPPSRPRLKAATEPAVMAVMSHLATSLRALVYRDLFGALHPEHENWSYEELKRLHDLFAIALLYESGCRAGELTSLKARDLQAATGTVRSAYAVPAWGKTGSQTIRFTERTAEIWRLWHQLRPFNHALAVWSWRRGAEPQPANTNGISQMIARHCRAAGVEPFRAHALRHSKVRRSRRLVGLELTSQLVGHSSLAVTQNYANIDEDELTRAATETGIQRDFWNR